MSKGSAPSPPDYTSAALAQGQANIDASRVGAALNRTNQVTPYGSTTYYGPGTYPGSGSNPSAPAPSSGMMQPNYSSPSIYGDGRLAAPASPLPSSLTGNASSASNPYAGGGFGIYGSPGVRGATGPGNLGTNNYNPASDQWTQVTQLSPEQEALYKTNVGTQQGAASSAASRLAAIPGTPGTANFQGIDTSGLTALPSNLDADRQKVQDSLYGEQTQYLDPQFSQQKTALDSQLVNEGLRPGDAAYDTAEGNLGLEKQQAYSNAQNQAITGATSQQAQQLASALGVQQQQFGQAQSVANTNNANASTLYGENSQNVNTALQQALSLYGVGQGQAVTPPSTPNATGPAAPDITGATSNQYQGAVNSYNAGQAQTAQTEGTVTSLAAIAALYF